MIMKRVNFVCLSVIGIALVIGFGNLSAANMVLSDAELTSLWGGGAQGCDRDGCCKSGNSDCTDIDCELAPVDLGGDDPVWKMCKGVTPNVSIHDCWLTTNISDNCERLPPFHLTWCYGICYDKEDKNCTGEFIDDLRRYNSNCDD